jgi:serine/threonine protein kinase
MTSSSLIGKQIDEYRLESMLGEGGMASVYRAVDTRLNRYVAIKVIRASLRDESDYTMRFEREARAIGQLEHPNIITLYRFGEKDGLLYMAMQYVDGADLAAVIESFHRDGDYIEFKEVNRVAQEIGVALDYAHSQGVIHRDIKPHKIMINRDGRVLVTDFGLALLTEIGTQGEIFGSPHYIAPEQAISSAGAVPQSDLYAMGVVIYEMLTGRVPFDAAEPLDIAMKHMSEPVPSPLEFRPELSKDVEKVALKALAKEPNERYATGGELASALKDALHETSRPAKTTITSKVELELEANPLPPIPPVAQQETQQRQSPITQQVNKNVTRPSSGVPRSRWYMLAGAGIAGLLVLVIMAIILLGGGSGNDDDTPEPTITTDAVAGIVDQTATTPATSVETPIQTEPVLTALSSAPTLTVESAEPINSAQATAETMLPVVEVTAAPVVDPTVAEAETYVIVIRWQGEDSLFVTNITREQNFPLGLLTLIGIGSVSGAEWDVDRLSNGECVAVWKDSGNPQTGDSTCTLVGNRLVRNGQSRFWKSSFVVLFEGIQVATCENSPCIVPITR